MNIPYNKLVTLFLLFFISFTYSAYSQKPGWTTYQSVKKIRLFAVEGNYFWISTFTGLQKLNIITGNYVTYDQTNSCLPTMYINAIAIDGRGNKWFGTDYGLVKFDGTDWIVYNTSNSALSTNCIESVMVDKDGYIWAGGGSRTCELAKFDGMNWTVYNDICPIADPTHYLGLHHIRAMAEDKSGTKWILANDGLVKFDGTNWTFYNKNNTPSFNAVMISIAIDNNGNKWVGSNQGLFKFDGTNWTKYDKTNSGLPEDIIRTIYVASSGELFFGLSPYGLVKFDEINWKYYNDVKNSTLFYFLTNSITEDKNGTFWIGTNGNGLVKFENDSLTIYKNHGPADDHIISLAIAPNGDKWIGTEQGLTKFDGSDWTNYYTTNSGLRSNYISAIQIDESGNKWIGTGKGLAKFDGLNWTVYNSSNSVLSDTMGNMITSIAIDSKGVKWIGTSDQGLASFDGRYWTLYSVPSNNWVMSVATDNNSDKWIGTRNGAAKFDGMNWTVYNTSNSGLPNKIVHSVAVEQTGTKWFGTEGGLAKFDGSTWTVFNRSNSGLPSNCINAIVIDRSGNKWIGTAGGLVKFDNTNWTIFTSSNSGLRSNGIQSIAIDDSCRIWIGTGEYGLAVLDEKATVSVDEGKNGNSLSPNHFELAQNYPNPFNPSTKIDYQLAKAGQVTLKIYDMLGREVAKLVDSYKYAGSYTVDFNAGMLSSGMYIYEIRTNDLRAVRKMVLVK